MHQYSKAMGALFCALSLLLLSNCAKLYGPMLDSMDEMKAEVQTTNLSMDEMKALLKASNHDIDELHKNTKLSESAAIYLDQDKKDMERIRAAQIFMANADLSKVIWQYIGAPMPLLSERLGPIYTYAAKDKGRLLFNFRNVTLIADDAAIQQSRNAENKIIFRRVLKGLTNDLYRVFLLAVEHMLPAMTDSAVPHSPLVLKYLSGDEEVMEESQDQALRIMHIGTALAGAVDLKVKDGLVEENFFANNRHRCRESEELRVSIANRMRRLLERLNLSDQIPILAALVKARMCLDKNKWNHPELD